MPHIQGIFGGGAGAGAEAPGGSQLVASGFYSVYSTAPNYQNLFSTPVLPGPAITQGQMVWGKFFGDCLATGDPKFLSLNISPTDNPSGGGFFEVQPLATVRFWSLEFWIVRQDSSNVFSWLRYQGILGGGAVTEQTFSPTPGAVFVSLAEGQPLYLWLRGKAASNNAITAYSMQIYRQ